MNRMCDSNESKYQKLRKLGQALKIPTLEAFLGMEVRDGHGRIIHQHKQRSHSWVRNAYNELMSIVGAINASDGVFGGGYINFKDTAGTLRSPSNPIPRWDVSVESAGQGYLGAAGADDLGIVVGSGLNAESFEDYALQTKILNGTTAGKMSYIASDPAVKSYNAGTKIYTVTYIRYFNNNSGGDVSVNETGIISNIQPLNGYRCMLTRDKLGATIVVPNTGQLKVTYTIQLIYPA